MEKFRVDIHHHCYYSRPTAADTKIMSYFAINESYDSPFDVYKAAKARGMNAVTITDHNVIKGGLKLKQKYDDVFISEEICAFFPEDNFRMHILALDIDERIHEEITRLRKNVYELVSYFKQANVLHVLAHPAWGPSVPPKRQHYEKFMVLFDKWEFLNGSRTWKNHDFVKSLAASYTIDKARALADKHGLPAPTHSRIIGVGGSDAHTRRNVGTAYSVANGANNYKEFLDCIRKGDISYEGQIQTLLPFAHTVYDLLGKHYSFGQRVIVNYMKDKPTKALARVFVGPFKRFTLKAHKDSYSDERLAADLDQYVVTTIKKIIKRLNSRRGLDLMNDLIHGLLDLGVVLGPLISSTIYKFRFNRKLPKADDFFPAVGTNNPTRVALIGDNMLENHGVSIRVRELTKHAQGKNHVLIPLTCAEKTSDQFRVIPSLHKIELPVYKGQFLHIPSVTAMLQFLEREQIEMVHVLTPGTVGLLALGAARLAGLPVIGSYHTDLADYIRHYHTNPIYSGIFEKVQTWFYNQCDLVLALSNHSRNYLIEAGVKEDKIQIMRTGVNHEIFNPTVATDDIRKRINPDNKFMILFAGRLEREKNIGVLLAAFAKIHEANKHTMLVIAGNGNLKQEIAEQHCPKYPAGTITFLDWVSHSEMAKVYAAADLMLFPSTTETFGNVILEAQSCALPTLVSNQGASAELIEHEKTGFICQANNDSSYAEAALKIISDENLRRRMRDNAVQLSQQYTWNNAVDKLFQDYRRLQP